MPPQTGTEPGRRRRGLRLPVWVPLCLAAGARAAPETCDAYAAFSTSAFEAIGPSDVYRLAAFSRTEAFIQDEAKSILVDLDLEGEVTLGAAPAPLSGEEPGNDLIVLCVGKDGDSWNNFQQAMRNLANAIEEYQAAEGEEGEDLDEDAQKTVSEITRELLLENYVCSERVNGLTLPAAGQEVPVLPPPVFLFGQRAGVTASNASLQLVRSDGSVVTILDKEVEDSLNNLIFPFTDRGQILGPGVIGPYWDSRACAIALTSKLRLPPDLSLWYSQLTLAVGSADMLPVDCYDRKCTYIVGTQYTAGHTVYYNVSQGLVEHERDFEGATFRVTVPAKRSASDPTQVVRARVGLVDEDWNEYIVQENHVTSGQSWQFDMSLNQSRRFDCAVPNCPRFFDNRTVTDPCGVCPWRLYLTVWPVTEPRSFTSAALGAFTNTTPCLAEDPENPTCIPVLPTVWLAIESRHHSSNEWIIIAILIVFIVFGGATGIGCFVDIFLLKARSRHDRGLHLCSCLCLRACPAETRRLCCCFNKDGCKRLCVWLWVSTKWLALTLWNAAGSTPPGHFPLQVVFAFILWIPFIVIFPPRIDDLFDAFVNFTNLFLDGDPIFVQSKEVLALLIGVIITYGVVMMAASWHISWTARELARGRSRPRTCYQWARLPTDKPPDNIFTRQAYYYADKKAGHMCGERGKACHECCCLCLGRWSVSCLDILVYCPHACMVAVTAGLFAIAAVLLAAAVPTRALADVLGPPVNLTTVSAVWDDIKDLLTPELTLAGQVEIVQEVAPEVFNPPDCIPPEDVRDMDRSSFTQLFMLPFASNLVINWYQREVADPEALRILEDAVYRVENSISDALGAPDDSKRECNENVFYALLYLDIIRIFLLYVTQGAVNIVNSVINIGDTVIVALSNLHELQQAMYDLADETEGLMAPTLCAMVAMAFSLNVWARSYGFIKGYEYHKLHGTDSLSSEEGQAITDANDDEEQAEPEQQVPPVEDESQQKKRSDTRSVGSANRTATESLATSDANPPGHSTGSVEA